MGECLSIVTDVATGGQWLETAGFKRSSGTAQE